MQGLRSATMSEVGFSYRPALDGMRCIAVAAVIVYHLDPRWLPGGFLGVDVFFTLSGYLITTLLLAEHRRNGRIGLPAFWARRARRLLPASLLVTIATVVWLAGESPAVQAVRHRDVIAAITNLMNWRLVASGQSYFESFTGASPLRHFWSLAVEEQFYLLWPALCLLLLRQHRIRTFIVFTALATVASVVACAWLYDSADPSRSYYGTDTRVHQILVGALLAFWLTRRGREGRPTATASGGTTARMGVVAAVALAASFALMTDTWSGYYRGGSLAIALLTALLIVAVETAPTASMTRALGAGPLAAIGRVSYGLYLWHWPIIVWIGVGAFGVESDLGLAAVRLIATAVIAAASYHLIERPIRHGRFTLLARPRNVAFVFSTALVLVGIASASITWNARPPTWATDPVERLRPAATVDNVVADEPPTRLGIVGDSVAASLAPGLTSTLGAQGWSIFDASAPGCPLTALAQGLDDGTEHPKNGHCAPTVTTLRSELLAFAPDVVLWHDLQSTLPVLLDGVVVPANDPQWSAAILEAWEQRAAEFRDVGAELIVVIPPLRSQDAEGACGNDRCDEIQRQDQRIRALTSVFIQRHAGDEWFHVLDLDPSVCPNGLPCPANVGGVELRLGGRDQTHFTPEGAAVMAPTLIAAIEAATR